jgi:hypothetical protein
VVQGGQTFHLPHATTACTTSGPLDPCCASCGEATPSGCTPDPSCTSSPSYTNADENIAIRALGLTTHKVRYGIEFMYPPSRYVAALSSTTLPGAEGGAVPNPLFAGGRSPKSVFYATISGVPWQLIARQKNGQPDLVNGVSDLDPSQVGGFKSFAELSEKDSQGNTFWDDIAGTPETYVAPLSPFMQESTVPRSGTDPITGIAISAPASPNGTNPINGHEWNIQTPPGDVQYSCILPAPTPIDCTQLGAICDCPPTTGLDNPLCSPNPNDSMNPTLQTSLAAYPALKHLAIAKGLGAQGIVASICPAELTDPSSADYGYLPAAQTIVQQAGLALREH